MIHYYIFTLILGWKVLFHPFYISLTDIRYNDGEKTIEIAQKIFWDDLERGLGEENNAKVDFLNPSSPEKLKKMIEVYVLKHNQITVNGKKVTLHFLGYEIEDDATCFELSAMYHGIRGRISEYEDVFCSVTFEDNSMRFNVEFSDEFKKGMLVCRLYKIYE
jgi:hypothetical protein